MSTDVQKVVQSLLTQADAIEQEAARVWAIDPAYSAVEVSQLNHKAAMLRDRAAGLESRADAWAAYNASQPTTKGKSPLESAIAMAHYYRDLAVKCPEAAPQLLKSAELWDVRVIALRTEVPVAATMPLTARAAAAEQAQPETWRRKTAATEMAPKPTRFSSVLSRLRLSARS